MSMATSKWASLAAVGAVCAFALTACGGSDSSTASSGGSSDAATGTVGVILPDATTSPRWENNDRPSLEAAFKAAGVGSDIQNAGGDTAKFGTICDSMINEGVKVLMIVNLDSDSGAACLKKASSSGIVSIDYDRLTLGGGAS
jgi:D-xylose transport system substrate-binding protein